MHAKKTQVSILLIILLVLVIATGCAPTSQPRPTESILTSPLTIPSTIESPIPTPYILPGIPGPAFAIDRPLLAGATQITGQGPANIPIIIVDVTLTGLEVGQGSIDSTGRFEIALTQPLEPGHRIGIMAGTVDPLSPEEITIYFQQLLAWKGQGARDLPFIGILFDTALVQE